MWLLTGVSLSLLCMSYALWLLGKEPVCLSLTITFLTFSYHFAMRLLVGYTVDTLFHNRMRATRRWFLPRKWEGRLYRLLRVRRWRKRLPTYDPQSFDTARHTWDEILGAGCQAEVVHEIIMLLSLLPILFALPFGDLPIFLATSLLAALYDSLFVILQRYHRPMLIKLSERRRKNETVSSGA